MSGLLPSLWGRPENDGAPLRSLHREIDKVFDEFNRGFGLPRLLPTSGGADSIFSPSMDVVENDKQWELSVELPGVNKKDVEVTLVDNTLTIRGEKNAEKKEEKDDYRLVERSYGSFKRTMHLPFDISADEIDAQFKDGVLKMVLPKSPEVEAKTQKVAIKSAGK